MSGKISTVPIDVVKVKDFAQKQQILLMSRNHCNKTEEVLTISV
jgi:hypothetical protein